MNSISLLLSTIVCCTLVLAIISQKRALYAAIFLAPWEGLQADFGLHITLYQVVLAAIIIATLLRALYTGIYPSRLPGSLGLATFVFVAVVWSLAQLPFLPETQVAGGVMRGPLVRAVIQIGMFAFTLSPLFLIPAILKKPGELQVAGKAYLWSVFALALIGWIQLLLWLKTDVNPIPLDLFNELLGGMGDARVEAIARIDSMSLAIYRMSSFGGEPKNLGAALVFAMLLIQIQLVAAKGTSRWKPISLWLFLAVSSVATLSTTAMLLWVIGTALHVTVQGCSDLRSEKGKFSGFLVIAMLLAPILLLGISLEAADIPIGDILLARTIERIDQSEAGGLEDFDDAILSYLLEHPTSAVTGVGLGNMHLYANSYLTPEVAEYGSGTAFTAKAQYLRFVSEIGLIGLSLFLAWFWDVIRQVKEWSGTITAQANLRLLVPFGVTSLVIFLGAASVAPQFYLTAGVISAAHSMRHRLVH